MCSSVVRTIQLYRQSWAMFSFCCWLALHVSRCLPCSILSGEFSRLIWSAKMVAPAQWQSTQHKTRIWFICHFYSFWRCLIYSLRSFTARKVAIFWHLIKPIWIRNRYFLQSLELHDYLPFIVSGSTTNLRRRYGKWKIISDRTDYPVWSTKRWFEPRSSHHWVQGKLKL